MLLITIQHFPSKNKNKEKNKNLLTPSTKEDTNFFMPFNLKVILKPFLVGQIHL